MPPMNTRLLTVIWAFALPLLGRAEDALKAEQVERLVRDFAFSFDPNLNTNTQFHIRKLEVKGLWEELKIQVFDIEYRIRGEQFNGFVGIYHAGKITSFAPTFGGYGLMSGVMHNGEFYYTYSWGSGVHRSHVAKLRLGNGELKYWDSGGFQDADLFVTASGGYVRVVSGEFKDFNKWERSKDMGTVRTNDSTEIQIIGAKGETVAPTFPYHEEKSQHLSRPRGQ